MSYDFEIPRIIDTIKDNDYHTVTLQFPEGLADHATAIAEELRDATGAGVIITADPCFGACDLADEAAKDLGAQCLFHFGHSPILKKTAVPVEYIEVRMDADPLPLFREHKDRLCKKVGLFTTVQHVHLVEDVKNYLEKEGFEVFVGHPAGRAKYPGQVLGCSFRTAVTVADVVNCYVYMGSGNFHPLGVALATKRQVLVFDILAGEVRDITPMAEKTLKQRSARMAKATDAETFGIIVGQKKGQNRLKLGLGIQKKLEKKGKKAYIISANVITPETLIPFRKLACLVNTACPRITIDDASRYKQPVLSPQELEIVLGEREWDDYRMDEF